MEGDKDDKDVITINKKLFTLSVILASIAIAGLLFGTIWGAIKSNEETDVIPLNEETDVIPVNEENCKNICNNGEISITFEIKRQDESQWTSGGENTTITIQVLEDTSKKEVLTVKDSSKETIEVNFSNVPLPCTLQFKHTREDVYRDYDVYIKKIKVEKPVTQVLFESNSTTKLNVQTTGMDDLMNWYVDKLDNGRTRFESLQNGEFLWEDRVYTIPIIMGQ